MIEYEYRYKYWATGTVDSHLFPMPLHAEAATLDALKDAMHEAERGVVYTTPEGSVTGGINPDELEPYCTALVRPRVTWTVGREAQLVEVEREG